jgi:hypothetical protein
VGLARAGVAAGTVIHVAAGTVIHFVCLRRLAFIPVTIGVSLPERTR